MRTDRLRNRAESVGSWPNPSPSAQMEYWSVIGVSSRKDTETPLDQTTIGQVIIPSN